MTATSGTNGSSAEVDAGDDDNATDDAETGEDVRTDGDKTDDDKTDDDKVSDDDKVTDDDVEDTSEIDAGEHEESPDDQLEAETEDAVTEADEVDAEAWFEALDAVDAEDAAAENPAEGGGAGDDVDGESNGVSNDGELNDGELSDGELNDGELNDGELNDGELNDDDPKDDDPKDVDPKDEVETDADPATVDELDETGDDGGHDPIADADEGNGDTGDDAELVIEVGGPPDPPLAPAGPPSVSGTEWTTRQLGSVLSRAAAIVVALAVIGFGLGVLRGGTSVARAEFVYTLDQSVPDSFLREDRRLLTQVATFTSDSVLLPVAQQFDLDVDDLRGSISIETVALSEVLRLEVTDPDAGRALAINRAVLDQYLQIITAAAPAGDSLELSRQRDAVVTELAALDQQLRELATAAERDAVLDVRQDSIQRQIDLTRDRTAALQGLVDDTIFTSLGASRTTRLNEELDASRAQLAALEAELTTVVGDRAELATATTTEPAVLRELERLERQLSTIDEELSQRELGPLVASPIRELSEPTVEERSAGRSGIRGAAIAALLALPLAAWAAYRTRRHQLWFG